MTSKECENQLNSLIEHVNNGGTDINATDIESIKHLLLENQMQHKEIEDSKTREESLTKYLEHQIFLYEKDIKSLSKDYKVYYSLIQEERHKLDAYKNLLEKVRGGKYETD